MTVTTTSPEGDNHYGWWRIKTVNAPRGLTLEDGFGRFTFPKPDFFRGK